MPLALTFGSKLIEDLTFPKPHEIDVDAIHTRLACIKRFSNNPDSLTVMEHVRLCVLIGRVLRVQKKILDYLYHHDDHEAFIGDIPGPVKALIAAHTSILGTLENDLDIAIRKARGETYDLPETAQDFNEFHHVDKLAETLEWQLVMGNPVAPWNRHVPVEIAAISGWLIATARSLETDVFTVALPSPPWVEDHPG
jgi:hypothetical protein